jgi:hypothetical protein
MKYAHVDNKGKLLGWYSRDVHGDNIPNNVVEVTDEQWEHAINNGHNMVLEDGSSSIHDFDTEEEKSAKARIIQNINARKYLDSTDWYIIRKFETGIEVPRDILDARAEARTKVIE